MSRYEMQVLPSPDTLGVGYLLLYSSIFSPFLCYRTLNKQNIVYWILVFCLVLLSIVIVNGVLRLEKQLKDNRERLIFGYSGILAYSIFAQFFLYYTDWRIINNLVYFFHTIHAGFLYLKFLWEPMNRHIFHYGNDQLYNPLIIMILTAFWGPVVPMPKLIFGHFYYNIIISLCYIDLSCVVRGYMTYSFHYEEEIRKKMYCLN